jgi:hypothetical protein
MAHKQVLFRSAAREKILRGATQLADAIRVTLGPRSKSVLIEKKWGAPIVCNDGVRSPRSSTHAVSVAGILLLAEATMTEIPEPTRERAMEPDRHMQGPRRRFEVLRWLRNPRLPADRRSRR